jgi:hypothetical protein
MSKAGKYILEGLNEALAIVKGEMLPGTRFTVASEGGPAPACAAGRSPAPA